MVKNWWKIVGVALVLYSIIKGLTHEVPALPILHETIRNLYYHVTMWFSMMIILFVSLIYSIKYLSSNNPLHDIIAHQAAQVGFFLGLLGVSTGMVWANYTWGAPWVNDPKLNGAAISLLIYAAYFILRSAVDEETKRAKLAGIYNIFSYVMLMVFIMVLPRMTDSLHPGNGGNPAFSSYDLDNNMRTVFYPAIIGWTLIGTWILNVKVRVNKLTELIEEQQNNG